MSFNSIDFLIFISIVFIIYWSLVNQKVIYQNCILLIGSYVFYGWWDYRFLSLIFLSTIVDFVLGSKIHKEKNNALKKLYLTASIGFNIGVLVYFKYANFFINSWIDLMELWGYKVIDSYSLNIILPVGISFYTFQTLSYTIDIYNKKIKPTNDFIIFASFVSFFPQLVAGPIERAKDFLPQLIKPRKFEYRDGINGLKLILWGLFKKVVIADALAVTVNQIFANYDLLNGGDLLLGVIYFSVQIYCDFSGYSDIAIGVARLFGIKLSTNFFFPYFSKNIIQFWKRWHISLTSWFRDYLYIPLGGSRVNKKRIVRNIFIVFIVSGFWHGANWTFVLWGFIHFLFFVFEKYLFSRKKTISMRFISFIIAYAAVLIGWVFFRSINIEQAFYIISEIFINFSLPLSRRSNLILILIFFFLEFKLYTRSKQNINLKLSFFKNSVLDTAVLYFLLLMLLSASQTDNEFIYFQF